MISGTLFFFSFILLPTFTFAYIIFSLIYCSLKDSKTLKLKNENQKTEVRILNKLLNKKWFLTLKESPIVLDIRWLVTLLISKYLIDICSGFKTSYRRQISIGFYASQITHKNGAQFVKLGNLSKSNRRLPLSKNFLYKPYQT